MSEVGMALPGNIDATLNLGQLVAPIEDHVQQFTVTAEDAAAVAALPPGSALLIVQRGGTIGQRFLLNRDRVMSGRSPKADIFLDDVTVSRKHAEFLRDSGGGYIVRDAGSLNGTYVNRERIDAAVLRPGDEVQIGKFRMSYQANPGTGVSVAL